MNAQNDREISALCEIQDLMHKVGFSSRVNLPTIIVVGSQSSGKSSVLEQIAGRDFLPRGQGIVTRRPTIIQRIVDRDAPADYAIAVAAAGAKSLRFDDFARLREFIQERMAEAAATAEGISLEPVVVKLFSPGGVGLTLIDMPGLTKIALRDQHPRFPQLIEEINRTFIQNPHSVLLAVSPANVDVANSDALRLAREYDAEGARTIGVFTKMDLVEDPTTVKKSFEGKAHPLKLGYFGVVCRSQADIAGGVAVAAALAKERGFFARSAFAGYGEQCGVPQLVLRLNRVLLARVRETLPLVKQSIEGELRGKEALGASFRKIGELHRQGQFPALLMTIVSAYNSNFAAALCGGQTSHRVTDKIYGGAKIGAIFEHEFQRRLYAVNPFEALRTEEVYFTLKNTAGLHQSLGFKSEAFEALARRQTELLRAPALDCLARVHEEVRAIAADILGTMRELQVFQRLARDILAAVDEALQQPFAQAKAALEGYLRVQCGAVNQKSPHFAAQKQAVLEGRLNLLKDDKRFSLAEALRQAKGSALEADREVVMMKNLLLAYNNAVKDQICDFVPKAIMALYIREFLATADQEILRRVLAQGNEQALAAVDQAKIDEIQSSEKETDALRRTLSLIEKYN